MTGDSVIIMSTPSSGDFDQTWQKASYTFRPAYPYDFGVLCTFFAPIVHLYAQQ